MSKDQLFQGFFRIYVVNLDITSSISSIIYTYKKIDLTEIFPLKSLRSTKSGAHDFYQNYNYKRIMNDKWMNFEG